MPIDPNDLEESPFICEYCLSECEEGQTVCEECKSLFETVPEEEVQ